MEQPLEKTLASVSDTYLETPVTLQIDLVPKNKMHKYFQQRGWFPKARKFVIHPVKLGSLVKISKILLKIEDGSLDWNNPIVSTYSAVEKHYDDIARIIAIAIVNKEKDPPEKLVKFIILNFSATELLKCLDIVTMQMNVSSFLKSIISVRGMNLLKMSPIDQGSQIASGVQLKE